MKKKEYMNILINYSEALDLVLTILHMFHASPDQKINESLSRTIVDRIFPTNDGKNTLTLSLSLFYKAFIYIKICFKY